MRGGNGANCVGARATVKVATTTPLPSGCQGGGLGAARPTEIGEACGEATNAVARGGLRRSNKCRSKGEAGGGGRGGKI